MGIGIALTGAFLATATAAATDLMLMSGGGAFVWHEIGMLVGVIAVWGGIAVWITLVNPPWPGLRALVRTVSGRSEA